VPARQSGGSFNNVIELDSQRHVARACWANGNRLIGRVIEADLRDSGRTKCR
jgi:hypothetical protein